MNSSILARVLLPAALCAPALADTFTVHPTPGMGDFTSVVDALGSPLVDDGDTVRVHAGVYTGLHVVSKAVLLESVDGAGFTTLDGAGAGTVVTIEAPATVQGFEITGGGGLACHGGVLITSAERATLRDCRIVDNHPTGDTCLPGGGVSVDSFASALVTGNVISSNTSLSAGGMVAGPFSEVDLIGNWITGNGSSGTTTGGILFGASGRIVNNQITGNYGTGIGGLYLASGLGPAPEGAVVDVVSNTIYGNRGTFPGGSAGGILLGDGGAITIVDTIVWDNVGSPYVDLAALPSFFTKGVLSLSSSHVKVPAAEIPPGADMVLGFLDPAFVAPMIAPPDGPTTFGDYHLTPASPDVDAGDTGAFPVDVSAGDLGGVLRVLGGSIDVGAYELGTSCDAPIYYGLGKIAASGERPYLISVGEPSLTSKFRLELHSAAPLAASLLVFGFEPGYEPMFGGTLWITPTVQALRAKPTDVAGLVRFKVRIDAAMVGTTRYYQCWFRDEGHMDGTGAGLSNAVAVTFCP